MAPGVTTISVCTRPPFPPVPVVPRPPCAPRISTFKEVTPEGTTKVCKPPVKFIVNESAPEATPTVSYTKDPINPTLAPKQTEVSGLA